MKNVNLEKIKALLLQNWIKLNRALQAKPSFLKMKRIVSVV